MTTTHAFASVDDARGQARRRLPAPIFRSVASGGPVTVAANEAAFRHIGFRPQAAMSFPSRDLTTRVLDGQIEFPVLTAPCGSLRLIHPGGDPAVARAAAACGTFSVISFNSGHTIQETRAATQGPMWKQLYMSRGRAFAEQTIDQARRAGYSALVVTVDATSLPPVRRNIRTAAQFIPYAVTRPGWLARFIRDGMDVDPMGIYRSGGADGTPMPFSPRWSDLRWIREQWGGPLVVKGVLSADDARRAVAEGAQAVVVSNHGGKGQDSVRATLAALPSVVDAVGADADVILDGGVRSGGDVVKAVAIGARAVLIGRPYVWALGAGGEAGVAGILRFFRSDIDQTLARIGCESIAALDRSFVEPFCDRPVLKS